MTDKNLDSKYERIGSWDVSLEVPQEVREQIREDFDYISRGEFSPGTIVNSGLGRMTLDRFLEEGKSRDEAFRLTRDKLSESAKRFYECYDDFIHRRGIEYQNPKIWAQAEKHYNEKDHSYAHHSLVGSTTHLTPDPFVKQDSYILDQPIDEHKYIVESALSSAKNHREKGRKNLADELESGLIVGEIFIQPYQTYMPFHERAKMSEEEHQKIMNIQHAELKSHTFRTKINWKTRESTIDLMEENK